MTNTTKLLLALASFAAIPVSGAQWQPPTSVTRDQILATSRAVLAMPDIDLSIREDIFRVRAMELDWDLGGMVYEPKDPARIPIGPDGRKLGAFLLHGGGRGSPDELPKVKILATGGTISGHRLSGAELVKAIPQLQKVAHLEILEFSQISSGRFTVPMWIDLANRINRIFADEPLLSGVVLTHGSNTIEETAYFLSLTVKSDRPVVLTGGQRSHGAISADGDKNLLDAVRVAVTPEARGKGVLVVANDEIHAAREVTKIVVDRPSAWESADYGLLGAVDIDRVTFYRYPIRKHTTTSEFDVSGLTDLPRVEIVYSFTGADGVLVEAAIRLGKARGLVVAAFPTGSPANPVSGPNQYESLKKASDSGTAVVITNRGGKGRIVRSGGTSHPTFIEGDNLTPQKARILLMLGLARTNSREELQRLFYEY